MEFLRGDAVLFIQSPSNTSDPIGLRAAHSPVLPESQARCLLYLPMIVSLGGLGGRRRQRPVAQGQAELMGEQVALGAQDRQRCRQLLRS